MKPTNEEIKHFLTGVDELCLIEGLRKFVEQDGAGFYPRGTFVEVDE